MNEFEKALAAVLGEKNLAKIRDVKTFIAGAGGLGSNCALYLARSGFKKFKIVDHDVVEYGNLNRQFYFAAQVGRKKVEALKENLLLVNAGLEIEALPEKIHRGNVTGFFPGCDVVVEALDGARDKKILVEACLESRDSVRLLVAASGLAGWGKSDGIKVHRINGSFFIVGDMSSEAGPGCPPLAPGVNVAAAKQADVVLSYFLQKPLL